MVARKRSRKMRSGQGKVVNKGGKRDKYPTVFVYVPSAVASDTSFPFEIGESVEVTIDTEKQRLIISKRKH